MKIKKAILTNTIEDIVDDTSEKIKENVMMRKSGLIDTGMAEERSGKIQLREKRPRVQIKEEPVSDSDNYSGVDEPGASSEDYEDSLETYQEQRSTNARDNLKIKAEKVDGEFYKIKEEQESVQGETKKLLN